KGAHKTVILKITIMASVRQDWEIMTTRQTGGLTTGYKPLILASASRRWLSLCSSHIALFSFAAPVRGVLNTSYP
ncbi:hypothetical protein, partial [Phascolarctobacterium succinatutens]|uniref:hypothetical protein n=1 Tax=Phascolarctobacterium succinatutens TaxID=626940 RepID=UPI0026F1AA1F